MTETIQKGTLVSNGSACLFGFAAYWSTKNPKQHPVKKHRKSTENPHYRTAQQPCRSMMSSRAVVLGFISPLHSGQIIIAHLTGQTDRSAYQSQPSTVPYLSADKSESNPAVYGIHGSRYNCLLSCGLGSFVAMRQALAVHQQLLAANPFYNAA